MSSPSKDSSSSVDTKEKKTDPPSKDSGSSPSSTFSLGTAGRGRGRGGKSSPFSFGRGRGSSGFSFGRRGGGSSSPTFSFGTPSPGASPFGGSPSSSVPPPSSSDSGEPRIRWQWNNNGTWTDYDDITQTILESAHAESMPSVELTHGFFGSQGGYKIDLVNLVQTKNSTGFRRPIKRVGIDGKEIKPPQPKWEYQESGGDWVEFDRMTFLLIEGTISRKKTTLVLNHGKWFKDGRYDVDFLNNTLTKRKPKKVRMPIRRVPPLSLDASKLFSGEEPDVASTAKGSTTESSSMPFKPSKEQLAALYNVIKAVAVKSPPIRDGDKPIRAESMICSICRLPLFGRKCSSPVVRLPESGDDVLYHRDCIAQLIRGTESGPGYLVCPVSGYIYGTRIGTMPEGTFTVTRYEKGHGSYKLPGHEDYGTIQCNFNFPSGTQGPEHPHPGVYYDGTSRVAYLPDNEEGQKVLHLFQIAWDRRLMFTIARSVTTGKDNQVVWNGIHCKTAIHGGKTNFGYPDEGYITRVMSELYHQGVTPECLETHDFSKPFSGRTAGKGY